MHNKLCPQYLCNCLPPTVSSISDHNLRNNENYTTPRSRFRMSMTSFIPSTVSLWNNLALTLRISRNISCFKSRIKENTGKYRSIMVKGPENKAYSMLDYDINAAQSVNVVHRMKIQFII